MPDKKTVSEVDIKPGDFEVVDGKLVIKNLDKDSLEEILRDKKLPGGEIDQEAIKLRVTIGI